MSLHDSNAFLLPSIMVHLGITSGAAPGDSSSAGAAFLDGSITTFEANRALTLVNDVTVRLNYLGYIVEEIAIGVTQAADAGHAFDSYGLYINLKKFAYTTASTSESANALQKLIDLPLPTGANIAVGLKLAPRPRFLPETGYHAVDYVPSLGFPLARHYTTTRPGWLLVGTTRNILPDDTLAEIVRDLSAPVTGLLTSLLDRLTALWTQYRANPAQPAGLLPYLDPARWGFVTMPSQHQAILVGAAGDIHRMLLADNMDFHARIDASTTATLEGMLAAARAALDTPGYSALEFTTAAWDEIMLSASLRELGRYSGAEAFVAQLGKRSWLEVLLILEELTVLDLLGRVRDTGTTPPERLPFDCTGWYDEIEPVGAVEVDPGRVFDRHTIQLNQAGHYAQGFWQYRRSGFCADTDETSADQFMMILQYRICTAPFAGENYADPSATDLTFNLHRWSADVGLEFDPTHPPQDTVFCNEGGTHGLIVIVKTDPPDWDDSQPYGVRLQITMDGLPYHFQRVSTRPYVPQMLLNSAYTTDRADLVVTERFPLHSIDKLRIIYACGYLIDKVRAAHATSGTERKDLLEEMNTAVGHLLARFGCYGGSSVITGDSKGPQLDQVRRLVQAVLSQNSLSDSDTRSIFVILLDFIAAYPSELRRTQALLGIPASLVQTYDSSGFHTYEYMTRSLGSNLKSIKDYYTLVRTAYKATAFAARVTKLLSEFADTLVPGLQWDFSLFELVLRKVSPLGSEGWDGQEETYFGIGIAVGVGLSAGVAFQVVSDWSAMYTWSNWRPQDFPGMLSNQGVNLAVTISPYIPYTNIGFNLDPSIESWLSGQTWAQAISRFVGLDPAKLRLGVSVGLTLWGGNPLTLGGHLPGVSSLSPTWVDYSLGLYGTIELMETFALIFRYPEFMRDDPDPRLLQQLMPWDASQVQLQPLEAGAGYTQEYEIDKALLTDADRTVLRQMVAENRALFANPNTRLVIDGHASPIGDEAYNLTLSQKRAQYVYDYILSLLDPEAIRIEQRNTLVRGFGELMAVHVGFHDPDDPAPEWQRVELSLNGIVVARLGASLQVGE